jgi:hypothetical protein
MLDLPLLRKAYYFGWLSNKCGKTQCRFPRRNATMIAGQTMLVERNASLYCWPNVPVKIIGGAQAPPAPPPATALVLHEAMYICKHSKLKYYSYFIKQIENVFLFLHTLIYTWEVLPVARFYTTAVNFSQTSPCVYIRPKKTYVFPVAQPTPFSSTDSNFVFYCR